MDLQAFLAPVAEENVRAVVSRRFTDGDGNPVEWEIRTITAEEDEALRRSCMKRVPAGSRKGQFVMDFDYNRYAGLLAAACTVFPDLNSQALQEGYHVLGADQLLKAMLKPGEYMDYLNRVQEVNGFHVSMGELVDEAKK